MTTLSTTDRIVAGYVRSSHSSHASKREAQQQEIADACAQRGLPAPVFYEDEMPAASDEQDADRPAFQRLLQDVEAGRVQLIIVSTLDCWSRKMLTTLHSLCTLERHGTGFVSLGEGFDSTTPEGKLQVAIMSAFVSRYPDVLAKIAEQDTDTEEGDEPPEM